MEILDSPEERVKLLRAGIERKQIEKMWLEHNNIKVISGTILKLDLVK